MISPGFVHLHVHSEYSLVDGIAGISALIEAARERNIPALALTDQQNMFGAVKFYKEAIAAGIKPIIGAEVIVMGEGNTAPHHLILLCQNNIGYRHLTELLSRAYNECSEHAQPLLKREWLQKK